MSEKREFPLSTVLGVSSGVLFGGFQDLHECVEFLTGGPVWTHEFASRPFMDMLAADVKRQHPFLAEIDVSDVTAENWLLKLEALNALHPNRLSLEPIPDYGRTKHPLETLAEVAPGKPAIVLQVP